MPVALDSLMRLVRPNLSEPDRSLVQRFVAAEDQAAFAALVERHGPMVLGVCRRVLRGADRAGDARELGWSLSTLRRRLEKGRELLRVRLAARGAALSAGLFAGALAPTARATVSDNLRHTTAALAIRGSAVPELIGQLAKEGVRMSSFT